MHTKVIEIKEYTSDKVGLLIQTILIELLLIFGIACIFNRDFMIVIYSIISLLMFTMAYNNYKFYKRKNMTYIYIIVGSYVLISTILEYVLKWI